MATDKVHSINCPTCGGPIPPFTGSQTRCPFCGTAVERPEEEKPVFRPAVPVTTPARPTTRSRGCVSPLVIGLAILLLAGGVALFLFLPSKGTAPDFIVSMSRSVQDSAIPVPADRQGPSDLLLSTYDSSSSEHYLTYIDGANATLKWDSPPVSTDVYAGGIVVRNQRVYLVDGATLLALEQSDGKVVWQSNLSDSVAIYCEDCLQVVGGYVIALSQDGVLQAFEAESGRPAWSERLNETPRNMWAVNETVAVIDYETPNDSGSIALQLRDPATGKVVQRFPGVCQNGFREARMSIYGPNIVLDPADNALIMLFDLLPGCVERWNLATGQVDWQLLAEDHYFDRFNAPLVLSGNRIYASYSGRVIVVDIEQGELDILADEEDYELAVQGEQGGIVIVLARRQRGSTRYELWGIDADSGHVPWKYIPQDEEPIEEAGGWAADKGFAWHLTRDGLAVLHMNAEPPTLVVGTLDLKSGQETVLGTAGLDDDYWDGLAWSDTTAWLTIRKVYVIDLEAGKVIGNWP
jgi:outer membrane protein assembly factor BamB